MRRTLVVLGSGVVLALLALVSSVGPASTTLRVAYIDVGQGDSIWLHASDGTDILIDGGPPAAGPTVVAYLQEGGIDDIEVMVLSHAHEDHVGGLIDILQSAISVDGVVINSQPYGTIVYQNFITELQARGITPTPAVAGQEYTWGALSATVLNPQGTPAGDQNDDSVVLLVSDGQNRFLFAGDITASTEQTLLNTGADVAAKTLKVAHHGSRYGSSMAFLNETGAEVAIISVGAGNRYGHPARETLARLQAAGMQVFRTDRDGTLLIREQTPMPTATPTATLATPSTPTEVAISSVAIGDICCETRDEYVRIDNKGSASQDLTDWRIESYESTDSGCVPAGQWYTFPTGYVLDAGASVYVHSGPDAANNPPTDLKWAGSYVWHNDGDVAVLYNAAEAVIDTYCYGECCP